MGLWTGSPLVFGVLAALAAVGGLTSRHPFDLIWQWGVRHLIGGPPLPPNPRSRRRPFRIAAPWLAAIALLYATGHDAWAFGLGAPFVVSCALATFAHYCVIAELFRRFGDDRASA